MIGRKSPVSSSSPPACTPSFTFTSTLCLCLLSSAAEEMGACSMSLFGAMRNVACLCVLPHCSTLVSPPAHEAPGGMSLSRNFETMRPTSDRTADEVQVRLTASQII